MGVEPGKTVMKQRLRVGLAGDFHPPFSDFYPPPSGGQK